MDKLRHLHLDLVGGLSGDMFISAMLDALPSLAGDLDEVIVQAGFPDLVCLEQAPHNDGVLTGTRFTVRATAEEGHHHRHYAEIRERLTASALPPAVRDAALDIFHLIAEVEAAIHGKSVDAVAFHEVGAWDSIADIVLAAHLITAADAGWSVSAIPAGRGFVDTAHGRLPVPAPATARLLEGFELLDDGIEGERVTPTGAAILKYLKPGRMVPPGHRLAATGYGFGVKRFPGLSNTARVSVYERVSSDITWEEDRVTRLSFDIDDQTSEELAFALEQFRAHRGVIDVSQQPLSGKKGRQAVTVSLLVNADDVTAVTAACFDLTSTLGVRREEITRSILQREEVTVHVGEQPYRVKVAFRPSGPTAKIEMDDLAASGLPLGEQKQVRQLAEARALEMVVR